MEYLLKKALFLLEPEQFPETCGYLKACLAGEKNDSAYEIAGTIIELDKPEKFPQFLIELVTELYEMAIKEKNDDAMNDLGSLYYDGTRGFEQSFEKAIKYYTMALRHGNRQAQENMGYCYYYGRNGEDPDYEKAFHYFALGAFEGAPVSLYKIGDMYLNSLYVEKNEREAFSIYVHCLRTMTEDSEPRIAGPVYLRLGKMLADGTGCKKDLKGALISLQKAEWFLTDMVMDGTMMYKKSLEEAIEGQNRVRNEMAEILPEDFWKYG